MPATVCAIMVTYNRLETLKTAIGHVLAQSLLPERLIIVDNNSTDGTRDFLASLRSQSNITCLYLDENMGCAGAIARGMEYALSVTGISYCWILDDDTFYKSNALQDLVMHIGRSHYSLLGLKGAKIRFGKKIPVDNRPEMQDADYAMMDGALISMEAIRKIGIVNDQFFMMCEDHEYCIRLKKYGFKVGVVQNGSDERLYLGGQGSFTSATLWRGYYSARNHLLIIKQYFSLANLLGYLFLQSKLIIAAAILAPDRFLRVKLRVQGIWHGIKGVEGKTLDPQTLSFSTTK